MPVLAVPYLMPYAQLAGLAIGSVATALGLKALSDKVQAHMEDNPEESMKILTMIMPAEGLMALFNKEAGEDEVIEEGEEIIDLDEDKPKRKRSKKEIILEALRKKKGSYASPEAEGSWASPRGRIIKGLAEEGHITDKPDPDYDPKKKYKGYKRFTRGRKADGGRIGFKKGGYGMSPGRSQAQYGHAGHAGKTEPQAQRDQRQGRDTPEQYQHITGGDQLVATDAGLPKIIKDAIEKRIVIPEDPQKKIQEKMWENLQKYKTLSKKKEKEVG